MSDSSDTMEFIRSSAIPTKYKGHLFRSRLESRWAVFFDAMDIGWEYEPEGFQMSDGTRYLPDFWLPRFRWFAEVKPTIEIGMRESKYRKFVAESKQAVLLLIGPPDFKSYEGVCGDGYEGSFSLDTINFAKATAQNRLWSDPDYDSRAMPGVGFSDRYASAIDAARSERFGA